MKQKNHNLYTVCAPTTIWSLSNCSIFCLEAFFLANSKHSGVALKGFVGKRFL